MGRDRGLFWVGNANEHPGLLHLENFLLDLDSGTTVMLKGLLPDGREMRTGSCAARVFPDNSFLSLCHGTFEGLPFRVPTGAQRPVDQAKAILFSQYLSGCFVGEDCSAVRIQKQYANLQLVHRIQQILICL